MGGYDDAEVLDDVFILPMIRTEQGKEVCNCYRTCGKDEEKEVV